MHPLTEQEILNISIFILRMNVMCVLNQLLHIIMLVEDAIILFCSVINTYIVSN